MDFQTGVSIAISSVRSLQTEPFTQPVSLFEKLNVAFFKFI
jgi:hypothetical protein